MGGLQRMIDSQKQNGVATGDIDADEFLRSHPNAILIGILLDQQMKAERAFQGPYRLHERLGHLDMNKIADMDLDELQEVFGEKPKIHRFYNMMAERTHDLAQAVVDEFEGDAANLWNDGANLDVIEERASNLPGFGESKISMLGDVLQLFNYRTVQSN